MKKKLNFLWIDDDPKRESHASTLAERLNVDMEFINVYNEDMPTVLSGIKYGKKQPDLILMDHILNNAKAGMFQTGSTASEEIRDKQQECPIICVTAVSIKDLQFDFHKMSNYEKIIDISKISQFDSTLLSIAESYNFLRNNRKKTKNVDDLLNLIKAPEDDLIRLKKVLPDYLKKDKAYQDKSYFMNISRWTRHTLMAKPGFLFDRLWSSTFLGIKEDSYNKVEPIFEKAKYSGIFADQKIERWWQSELRKILFLQFPDSNSVLPWELGRNLNGIKASDNSKCYASGEDYPEIVAYTDITAKKREPMKISHTIPHPNFEKLLYFEEIRMMS